MIPSIITNTYQVNQTIPNEFRKRNALQNGNHNSVKYIAEAIYYLVQKYGRTLQCQTPGGKYPSVQRVGGEGCDKGVKY